MQGRKDISAPSNGARHKGVRHHNERLVLSLLQRHRKLPGSQLARRAQLSAQTVSVILRRLEADGLVLKEDPVKGQVGKPFVPMALNPDGAYAIGCKIGRRSCEILMMDLCGGVMFRAHLNYEVALPAPIFRFIAQCYRDAVARLDPDAAGRLCGIGIAAPFEIWKWDARTADTPPDFLSWQDISFEAEVARFSHLPVFAVNDATSACWAEHIYGCGRRLRNYAYFFVSAFIGGGVVLNEAVYEGRLGNAGAFGPLRVGDSKGRTRQLLEIASIHVLEQRLSEGGHDPRCLWEVPQDWRITPVPSTTGSKRRRTPSRKLPSRPVRLWISRRSSSTDTARRTSGIA